MAVDYFSSRVSVSQRANATGENDALRHHREDAALLHRSSNAVASRSSAAHSESHSHPARSHRASDQRLRAIEASTRALPHVRRLHLPVELHALDADSHRLLRELPTSVADLRAVGTHAFRRRRESHSSAVGRIGVRPAILERLERHSSRTFLLQFEQARLSVPAATRRMPRLVQRPRASDYFRRHARETTRVVLDL